LENNDKLKLVNDVNNYQYNLNNNLNNNIHHDYVDDNDNKDSLPATRRRAKTS
jgi:hypothetical protein